jgi:hypothetical protein
MHASSAVAGAEGVLNRAGLDADAAHIDLGIAATQVLDASVAQQTVEVLRRIHAAARGAERIWQEALRPLQLDVHLRLVKIDEAPHPRVNRLEICLLGSEVQSHRPWLPCAN